MKNNSFLWLTLAIATIVSLGCLVFSPDASSDLPTAEPYDPPLGVPTATLSITELPPLPDFEQTLTFGGGGTGDDSTCEDPGNAPAIEGLNFGYFVKLCLWGVEVEAPFKIVLTSPDGMLYETRNILVRKTTDPSLDPNTLEVNWEGYQTSELNALGEMKPLDAFAGEVDKVNKLEIYIKWPGAKLEGTWGIEGAGAGFQATYSMDIQNPPDKQISALNLNSDELIPLYEDADEFSIISLNENNQLDVIGGNFPPDALVYVLLYRSTCCGQMLLIQQQSVLADHAGSFRTETSASFEPNVVYALIGISSLELDDSSRISKERFGGSILTHDTFKVASPITAALLQPPFTCPGAPPQRVAVNQRGYVCTKSASIIPRYNPDNPDDLSAELPTGAQFDVTSGPWCQDGNSWWRILTDDWEQVWVSEGGDEVDPYFICPLP